MNFSGSALRLFLIPLFGGSRTGSTSRVEWALKASYFPSGTTCTVEWALKANYFPSGTSTVEWALKAIFLPSGSTSTFEYGSRSMVEWASFRYYESG